MMAGGRFAGDRSRACSDRRDSCAPPSARLPSGSAAALLSGGPGIGIIGFGLVGLGIANVIPVVFSAASRVGGLPPATALAAVATTGYGGYLAGPPLIGLAAEVAGLPAALGILAVACAVIAISANAMPRPRGLVEPRSAANRMDQPAAPRPAVGPP